MTDPTRSLDLPELPAALRESPAPEVLAYVLALEALVLSLREQDEEQAALPALFDTRFYNPNT